MYLTGFAPRVSHTPLLSCQGRAKSVSAFLRLSFRVLRPSVAAGGAARFPARFHLFVEKCWAESFTVGISESVIMMTSTGIFRDSIFGPAARLRFDWAPPPRAGPEAGLDGGDCRMDHQRPRPQGDAELQPYLPFNSVRSMRRPSEKRSRIPAI